jgi:hypothetical protein
LKPTPIALEKVQLRSARWCSMALDEFLKWLHNHLERHEDPPECRPARHRQIRDKR